MFSKVFSSPIANGLIECLCDGHKADKVINFFLWKMKKRKWMS